MLLYLSWSSDAANDSRVAKSSVLQHVHATFLNVEELIKDHKLQVDSENFKVKYTIYAKAQQECYLKKTETRNRSFSRQSRLSVLDRQ